jgi:CelD/BcsL family acetyltransferase involved in cellulose biosynthesis
VRSRVEPASAPILVESVGADAVRGAWEELVDERHPGAVFRSPAWLLPWWNAFSAPGDRRDLRLLVARSGARVVGLLPAYRAPTALGGRRLRLLGDGIVGSDYLGVLAAPGMESLVAASVAERLLEEERDLALDGMTADEPLSAALVASAARRGLALEIEPLLPCPFATLDGDFDTWLGRLPLGAGAQLRRRRRWLERQPGFRIETAERPDEVLAAMETLFLLNERRWSSAGGSDAIDDAAVRSFHREAAVALARRGIARVYLLHVAGAVRAALYGFERGGRFAFYQSGSDPAWRQRSVGSVVLGAAIEDAFRRGLGEFDFLRGDERYKATFASARRRLRRTDSSASSESTARAGREGR